MAADRRLRRLPYVLLSLLPFLLLPAAAAHAGGLPPTSLDAGPEGVLDHTGDHRFTATPLATKTVLTKSETHSGRVLRASVLRGRWGVPVVANDSTSGGLSADGRTLALTRVASGYPRTKTSFAVIDTASMALRDTVHLNGEWRADALSPNGRRLHLIEHRDRLDPRRQPSGPTTSNAIASSRRLTESAACPSPAPRDEKAAGPTPSTPADASSSTYSTRPPVPRTASTCPTRSIATGASGRSGLAVRKDRNAIIDGDHIVTSAATHPPRASAGGGPPWLAVAVAVTGLALAATATPKGSATSRRSRELR